jgi:hypothetical protein
MNSLGIYLFLVVVNQTSKYNNNQYYADTHLGERSKRQYKWIRNKNNMYVHFPKPADSGLGCSR